MAGVRSRNSGARHPAKCRAHSFNRGSGAGRSEMIWDYLELFWDVLSVAVFHTCDTPAHCWPLVPVIAGAHVAWEPKTWLAKKTVARSYWQLVKLASMLLTQWICRRLNFWMTFHLVYILAQTIGRNCRRNITGWLPRNGLANSQRWSLYLSIKACSNSLWFLATCLAPPDGPGANWGCGKAWASWASPWQRRRHTQTEFLRCSRCHFYMCNIIYTKLCIIYNINIYIYTLYTLYIDNI